MACEVGLYYVLHITKQRNKNALLRLLPGLGECARGGTPLSSQTPSALATACGPQEPAPSFPMGEGPGASQAVRPGRELPTEVAQRPVPPGNLALHAGGTLRTRKTGGHPGALQEPAAG